MNNKIKQVFEQLLPFIVLGMSIALVIGLFIMLSYVLVWGVILGAGLWIAVMIKNYLFPSYAPKKSEGRIIEHDDKGSKD